MEHSDAEIASLVSRIHDSQGLSLYKLSEPILEAGGAVGDGQLDKRDSDASNQLTTSQPTPASLNADLTHYKDLFTKLRFSYTSQVTKEKFIRSVISSPLPVISNAENVKLEGELGELKAALNERKASVAQMLETLEKDSRLLVHQQQTLRDQAHELETLPAEIRQLKEERLRLKDSQAGENEDNELSLPLEATLALIRAREANLQRIDRELAVLQPTLERKDKELERQESELVQLETQRRQAIEAAEAAMRRRVGSNDGYGDETEQRGRWLKGVEGVMVGLGLT